MSEDSSSPSTSTGCSNLLPKLSSSTKVGVALQRRGRHGHGRWVRTQNVTSPMRRPDILDISWSLWGRGTSVIFSERTMTCLQVKWTQRDKPALRWSEGVQACSLPASTQERAWPPSLRESPGNNSSPCLPPGCATEVRPHLPPEGAAFEEDRMPVIHSCSKAGEGGHLCYSIASKTWRWSKVDCFVCPQIHQMKSRPWTWSHWILKGRVWGDVLDLFPHRSQVLPAWPCAATDELLLGPMMLSALSA